MKKFAVLLLTAFIAIQLCGCNSLLGFDSAELMRPPKATGDKAEIQRVIDESAGSNYTLKYPQSGDYRSAITMIDLDRDEKQEAIAFYRLNNTNDPATRIEIIAYRNNAWVSAGSFEVQATEVNRLAFADFDGDGSLEIVSGWGAFNSTICQLTAYKYSGGSSSELLIEQSYSSFSIGDFTSDGSQELMLFSLLTTEAPSLATLIDLDSSTDTLGSIGTVLIDPDITRFASIQTGKTSQACTAAVVDGITSVGTYNTQVICYNAKLKVLENRLYRSDVANPTTRTASILSTDIDSDQNIEIPVITAMNAARGEDVTSVASLTSWSAYNETDGSLAYKQSDVSVLQYGYHFRLPELWENGRVTARISSDSATLEFFEWSDGKKGELLLTIQAFPSDQWLVGSEPQGYTLLDETTDYAFAYKSESDSPLALKDEDITRLFVIDNRTVLSAT